MASAASDTSLSFETFIFMIKKKSVSEPKAPLAEGEGTLVRMAPDRRKLKLSAPSGTGFGHFPSSSKLRTVGHPGLGIHSFQRFFHYGKNLPMVSLCHYCSTALLCLYHHFTKPFLSGYLLIQSLPGPTVHLQRKL